MSELEALYYGYVQLIPGIICDGYILNDANNTTVMSGRVSQKPLRRWEEKGP